MSVRIEVCTETLTKVEALTLAKMFESYAFEVTPVRVSVTSTAAVLPDGAPIHLAPEDQMALAEAVIDPSEPNAALQRAFEKREELTGSSVGEPGTKARRGRPKKEEAAPTGTPDTPVIHPKQAEFDHLLAVFNDTMEAGGLSSDKRREACQEWTKMGPDRIEDLQLAIEKNKDVVSRREAAKPLPTLDELRAALQKLTEAKGLQAGIDLLADFKCARVSEIQSLPVAEQHKFIEKTNA